MKVNKPQVYIIDDDQVVLFLHKILVKKAELSEQLHLFMDAELALESIISLNPSAPRILIFLDINMPKMDGWGFLTQLENSPTQADIKVIMVTSSLSLADKQKALKFKTVLDFWEKPMDSSHLSQLKIEIKDWLQGL